MHSGPHTRSMEGDYNYYDIDKLLASAGQLTELLRPEAGTISDSAALLLEQVKQDYAQTVGAIRAFLDEESPAV